MVKRESSKIFVLLLLSAKIFIETCCRLCYTLIVDNFTNVRAYMMTRDKFKLIHSERIMQVQCIESDLKFIYAGMHRGNFERNLNVLEKEKFAIIGVTGAFWIIFIFKMIQNENMNFKKSLFD